MAEDCLEVYENRADRLSNNLRLCEISILTFFQFYFKNRNQLEIVVIATYGLYPNKYFEILDLTFWGRSLVTKRFGIDSYSWGADEIKDLLILIDFHNRNMELLFLFSIISPCFRKYSVGWSCLLYIYETDLYSLTKSEVPANSENMRANQSQIHKVVHCQIFEKLFYSNIWHIILMVYSVY